MANIEYIKNVIAFTSLDVAPGVFSSAVTNIPTHNPDEVIVRALNFNGQAGDAFLYLVWSNLTNDYIASFCGENVSPNCPQTVIRLNCPIPNLLEFKLFRVENEGSVSFADDFVGNISIHLDFIKYKKVPVHA